MRRGELPAHGARVFGKLQRARAGRGIDVVEVHHLGAHTIAFDQFQRDVVILIPFEARPQALHLHREGEPHLNTGIEAFEVRFVIVQRGFDHVEAEGAVGVLVERPHNPRHVDAFLVSIKAHGSGHGGFQRQIAVVTGVKADRQAEIGNADVLDLLARTTDQAGRPVLKVWQGRLIAIIRAEPFGVFARECRIIDCSSLWNKARDRRVEFHDVRHGRLARPTAQGIQSRLCFGLVRITVDMRHVDVHEDPLGFSLHHTYGNPSVIAIHEQHYGGSDVPDHSDGRSLPRKGVARVSNGDVTGRKSSRRIRPRRARG